MRAGPHGAHALLLFIAPPSLEELERRLRGRGTETEERVQRRLANAHVELAAAEEAGFADAVIVNDDLDAAYRRLEEAIAGHVPDLLPASDRDTPQPGAADRDTPQPGAGGGGPSPSADAAAAAAQTPAEAGPFAGQSSTAGPSSSAAAAEEPAGTKEYLRATVVPAVEAALLAVAASRPDDPLQFVIEHLQSSKL